MEPERLSSLDASFWYLEQPAMHMHFAATSVFDPREDGPLTFEDVQRVVLARIHQAPRLRERVVPVPGNISLQIFQLRISLLECYAEVYVGIRFLVNRKQLVEAVQEEVPAAAGGVENPKFSWVFFRAVRNVDGEFE